MLKVGSESAGLDPYCWSGSSCLRNRLGIKDAQALHSVESKLVSARTVAIARDTLPGEYNLEHLKRFHRYLFSDVYGVGRRDTNGEHS
jgi:cell filamentation protein